MATQREPQWNADSTANPRGKYGYDPDRRYKTTKSLKDRGIKDVFSQLGNFMNDTMRNTGNFGSSAVNYLSGGREPGKGSGFGDYLVGRAPARPTAPTQKKVVPQAQMFGDSHREPQRRMEQAEEEQIPGFEDFLAMANELGMGGGSGRDYSGLRSQLQGQASESDAALKAMYSQLRGSIDADAAGIGQNYDTTAADIGANGAAAVKTTNDAANAARAAQTAQFEALGIGDAAAVLASQGGAAASDQAAAVSNIAQNQAAGQNQAVANKSSALNYNTGVSNAAGLEGGIQRANLQADLQARLAEIGMAEQQDQGSGRQEQFSAAMQLMGMDRDERSGEAQGMSQQRQQDFENQLAIERLLLDQNKAKGSQVTLEDSLGQYNQIAGIAQKLGVPDDQLGDFIKNLQASNRL